MVRLTSLVQNNPFTQYVHTAGANAGPPLQTVPLRACCPECVRGADAWASMEEAFSRGAQRVRRRAWEGGAYHAGQGFPTSLAYTAGGGSYATYTQGGGYSGAQDSLFRAAQAGGFLNSSQSGSPAAGSTTFPQNAFSPHSQCGGGMGLEGNRLLSGTGLAEVNRLVAELERRRERGTPSPSPSSTGSGGRRSPFAGGSGSGGTSPCFVGSPSGYGGTSPAFANGSPTGDGRVSPSLLGPALARVAGERYGEHLTAPEHAYGNHRDGNGCSFMGHGSGQASPLLPLGIAVDEVDKEMRRRSVEFGTLGAGAGADMGTGKGGVVLLGEDEDEEDYGYEYGYEKRNGKPPRTPSPPHHYPHQYNLDSPSSAHFSTQSRKRSSYQPQTPVCAYADEDDADLFPLPAASSSRGSTPRGTPAPSPRGSPGGSDVSVHRVSGDARLGGARASPKAGGLLPAALAGYVREGSRDGTPPSPHAKDGSDGQQTREKSRSEAVCVALGSMGRREREERERAVSRNSQTQAAEVEPRSPSTPGGVAKCKNGLLIPVDERERERERDRTESSSTGTSSREGSRESGTVSEKEEARDSDKPLPVLPRLATSVLAAGPYSPALVPRPAPAVLSSGKEKGSHHLRIASAPAASPTVPTSPPAPSPPPAAAASVPAPKPLARAVSSSSSTPKTKPKPRSTSTSGSSPATTSSSPTPGLRRVSSFARLRSTSTSSTGKGSAPGAGRKVFGAFVDVLKGVTSISGGTNGVAA
ncbi:hypothetical protein C8R43DRAFT_150536 [Mycena crocata]|nr:hypothetical protein C8R43DRAFT_150536 [Mycena crocata]